MTPPTLQQSLAAARLPLIASIPPLDPVPTAPVTARSRAWRARYWALLLPILAAWLALLAFWVD
jgi:hypothetical protein